MIRSAIGFTLRNLPAILFAAAVVIAAIRRSPPGFAERFLDWLLLLPIGVTAVWAGVFHVFFARTAAAYIGWQVSPFQYEVGMADLAVGSTAVLAFWRPLSFKAAAVSAASVFLLGDALGHIRDMVATGNFAAGNAGLPFYMDIICPVLAITLLMLTQKARPSAV